MPPSTDRLFSCTACGRDVGYMLRSLFGIVTFTCLCHRCGQATLKKWPEAMDPPEEATP